MEAICLLERRENNAFYNHHQQKYSIGNQGGRGHWTVYYTSPQSFIVKFSYSLAQQLWELLLNFDWLVY